MQRIITEPVLFEIHLAAQQLNCSSSLLRKLERERKTPPAIRTAGGVRLYTPQLIEAIRAAREATDTTRQDGARA